MFGISLPELIVILITAIIFIRPKDLPQIAYFLGKIYYRAKYYLENLKDYFKKAEEELGIDNLKTELQRGIISEQIKLEENDENNKIIDMYGNEHIVANLQKLRSDISKEEIEEEIRKLNEENQNHTSLSKEENKYE